MATDINPLQTAIALGKGRGTKEVYHFGSYLKYLTRDGKLINPWATGEYVDPKTHPKYDRTEPLPFQAGVIQELPVNDEEFIREIVAREEFARPELKDQIDQWVKDGLESHDLIDKVKEANGLVTLADFGIDDKDKEQVKATATTNQGG